MSQPERRLALHWKILIGLLVGASLGAALIPARRASTVNPTDALRCE